MAAVKAKSDERNLIVIERELLERELAAREVLVKQLEALVGRLSQAFEKLKDI